MLIYFLGGMGWNFSYYLWIVPLQVESWYSLIPGAIYQLCTLGWSTCEPAVLNLLSRCLAPKTCLNFHLWSLLWLEFEINFKFWDLYFFYYYNNFDDFFLVYSILVSSLWCTNLELRGQICIFPQVWVFLNVNWKMYKETFLTLHVSRNKFCK